MTHVRSPVDLLVVGGGINGAGIARDAAGRGLSVLLVEQDDLAGATSSASSKLIHGGLRYLEHYEFRLVREALAEREVLLRLAPHIIWPMTFVLPHDASVRPAWMIRAGLFLYDHLASRRTLPRSARVDLARGPFAAGLKPSVVAGFSYADCWVEDSRLVVLNAIDARERGAQIRTRCRFEGARREGGLWEARLSKGGQTESIAARAIVNAAGPWVANALRATGSNTEARVRLIKGSHIVVPKLYDGAHAFILQNDDERVVFAIPYEGRYTLIGTTDVLFSGDPADIAITPDEVTYLCRALSRTFASAPTPADVVWSYAGVRPLYDDDASDPSAITRDYVLELDGGAGRAPLLSIFGGKITTYRRLAEEALHKLGTVLPISEPAWTARSVLPGGDIGSDLAAFEARTRARYPWLPAPTARRLVRAYGSRVDRILDGAGSLSDLGDDLGAGLSSHEVAYLRREEWAVTATDILWRRSKLGLHGGPALAQRLESWLSSHPAA